jgi:dTDP-4-dehydrorhamnose reductase
LSSFDSIWITGAGGLIGNHLVKVASQFVPGSRVIGLVRTQLDLTDFAAVEAAFRRDNPHLIIHCAAMSKSTECQINPALARKVNTDATRFLSELADGIPLLFFSTDLVFDGRLGNYDESAAPNPLSIYAESKVAAERTVLANPLHSVIRTSLNGGSSPSGNRTFNEEIRRAWKEGRTLHLFTDEFRSPIPAEVTAQATWELALRNRPGLYHLAGSERLSRWQIGQLLAPRWPQLNPKLEPASIKDYSGAPRAPDTSLNSGKVQQLLSFPLPGLTAWLAKHPNEQF